jgi:hypothetical protein
VLIRTYTNGDYVTLHGELVSPSFSSSLLNLSNQPRASPSPFFKEVFETIDIGYKLWKYAIGNLMHIKDSCFLLRQKKVLSWVHKISFLNKKPFFRMMNSL